MVNCTILSPVIRKKIISDLKNSPELPFGNLLSKDGINQKMQNLTFRDRIFTPDVTLLAFLSQVMNDDQSQQAAVAKVIATLVASGANPPSSNTSAYSQARSRLPESILASLAIETATELESSIP